MIVCSFRRFIDYRFYLRVFFRKKTRSAYLRKLYSAFQDKGEVRPIDHVSTDTYLKCKFKSSNPWASTIDWRFLGFSRNCFLFKNSPTSPSPCIQMRIMVILPVRHYLPCSKPSKYDSCRIFFSFFYSTFQDGAIKQLKMDQGLYKDRNPSLNGKQTRIRREWKDSWDFPLKMRIIRNNLWSLPSRSNGFAMDQFCDARQRGSSGSFSNIYMSVARTHTYIYFLAFLGVFFIKSTRIARMY